MKNQLQITIMNFVSQLAFRQIKYLLIPFLFAVNTGMAQNAKTQIAKNFLEQNQTQYKLDKSSLESLIITDQYTSKHNGVTHIYFRQTYNGIEVYNANININISEEGKVLNAYSNTIPNFSAKLNATKATINQVIAVERSAKHLDILVESPLKIASEVGGKTSKVIINKGAISRENIPVKLMYVPMPNGKVRLAWNLVIQEKTNTNWWNMRVDALTGEVLSKNNWTTHDNWGTPSRKQLSKTKSSNTILGNTKFRIRSSDTAYNVFAVPVESPNHGNRSTVSSPSNTTASPFGWHDTDGVDGAEFTITRGNNVYAYEDRANANAPGYSPDGGASLNFDFPLDFSETPETNQDAAITNLFYWNNIMHDVYYRYGFDEASGNFQKTNYTAQGVGNDAVNAEAQDGGGTNNANFGTPPEGASPRMQMFLWGSSPATKVLINSPSTLAGTLILAVNAGFGGEITADLLTADIVLFDDGTGATSSEACNAASSTNAAALVGKIALIDRGSCEFGQKVLNAQNAGAIAVIVCNNQDGAPIVMAGGAVGDQVTIPAVMIAKADCEIIKTVLSEGVGVSIYNENFGSQSIDGDFDNGIIAHEYGHGISIRLTGGPANSGCLSNAEQMGEGWSDFFGLMLTMKESDTRGDAKGIGTYAIDQPVTGGGIRNAPYSTDFSVNNFTYGSVADVDNVSAPHGVGFIWGTALWEMTWDLIDKHGYDSNLYNGTSGNNIAMQLVLDGLKLQPCSPGFIDGRDAILLADRNNNGGANQGLIWAAFAKRGLGFSADQGSSASRTDQTEAFDLPNISIDGELDVTTAQAGARVTVSLNVNTFIATQSDIIISAVVPAATTYVDGSATNSGALEGSKITFPSFNMGIDENINRSYQLDVTDNYSKINAIDRMENGTDNWDSSGTNNSWENKSWEKGEYSQRTGLFSWFAENKGAVSEQVLNYTVALEVVENSAFSFWHFYSTEQGWDGGIVEISTDDGTSWNDLGDKMILNGYNSRMGEGSDNPLGGRAAFSGESNGHLETIIDLSSFSGETALFRFKFAEDDNAKVFGWAIDDIAFINLVKITNKICVESAETSEKCFEIENVVQRNESQNVLPTLTNVTVKIAQNEPYTFSPALFLASFTDADFDFLEKIVIKTLPENGTLTLNGNSVSIDDEISYKEIANLILTPTAGLVGTNQFEWNGYDGYGFATENAIFQATANEIPIITDFTVNFDSQLLTFSPADFEANFTDTDGGTFEKIKIMTLPILGSLRLENNTVSLNQEIILADISKLTYDYTSGATSNLIDKIGWSGFDGLDYSAAADVLVAIDPVLSVNDAFLLKSTTIYPNPVENVVHIKIDNNLKEDVTVVLFNNLGQKLEYKNVKKKSLSVTLDFELQNLPMGIYILQISQGGFVSTQKIVKQ